MEEPYLLSKLWCDDPLVSECMICILYTYVKVVFVSGTDEYTPYVLKDFYIILASRKRNNQLGIWAGIV